MGRQYARTTMESVYNTFPGTPPGGSQNDFFLPQSNAMTVRAMPQFWEIRDAGVGNRLTRKNIGRTNVGGRLQSYLFPSQADYVLKMGTTLTGTSCLDIPSFTMDHIIAREYDCANEFRRYTGCKVSKLSLAASSTDQGWLWAMGADIIGSTPRTITVTDFPIPALSSYPTDDPYQFNHAAGFVTIGSSRSNFQSISLEFNNVLKPFPDENVYIQNLKWFGRTINVAVKLMYKSNADRLAFEAGTKQNVVVELNNGPHTLTMTFGAQCNLDQVEDDLPLDDWDTQMLTLTALMDPATGPPITDFSCAVT